MRLIAGALDVRGEGVVTTQFGVVRVAGGSARLVLLAEGIEVRCDTGEARIVGPLGTRSLSAGERVERTLGG